METVLCGVQHVAPDKAEIGYDRVLDGPVDYFTRPELSPHEWDRENAGRVAAYLREEHVRPFFLSYGLLTTHRPYPEVPEEVPERGYHEPPPPVPDTPQTRYDTERFLTGLSVVDDAVGVVLDAVREAGLWEDTVILLTTDHGPAFPEMKSTLKDTGTGVSLLLRIPGSADDGRVEQALVSQLDLYPTMVEFAGAAGTTAGTAGGAASTARAASTAGAASGAVSGTEGRSLLPLLRGEVEQVRSEVFSEVTYHATYEPARAVRTARYKLIRHFGPYSAPRPANVDDSPGKETLGDAGYFDIPKPRDELFDLLVDPSERMNFAAERAYRGIYDELSAVLDRWMRETNDPLRAGPVPRPEGAVMNREDAWSPQEPTDE